MKIVAKMVRVRKILQLQKLLKYFILYHLIGPKFDRVPFIDSELRPALSGVSKVSQFVIWFRIKNRTPRWAPEAQVAPFPKFSNNYLLWYGQDRIYREKYL